MALSLLGLVALGNVRNDGFHGRGVDTTATILENDLRPDTRSALVGFTSAAGTAVTARIEVCHHQTYEVGNSLEIRYDAARPSRALERDMAPVSVPLGLVAVVVIGALTFAAWLRSKRVRLAGPLAWPAPTGPRLDEPEFPIAEVEAYLREQITTPVRAGVGARPD